MPPAGRRSLVQVLGLAGLAALAGCGAADGGAGSQAFLVPPGAHAFQLGELAFETCELPQQRTSATTAAWCAPFEVPENHAQPEGRRIHLRLALLPAGEAADDDFLVLLAGGPGQSAVESWPQVAAALAPSARRRHVLLLDQRGTGGSSPLDCPELSDDELHLDPARAAGLARACLARLQATTDVRQYTTTAAVADLEAVRQALGAPRLDLVGISYGTRVAQQYARAHPQATRALVLDSPVPNDLAIGQEFARNLDQALDALFDACANDRTCSATYGDQWLRLRTLRERLDADPVLVSAPSPSDFSRQQRRLDGAALAGIVRLYAYSTPTAALIPLLLREVEAGRLEPAMAQLQIIERSLEGLSGSGMALAVLCSEDIDRLQPDPADSGTLLGHELTDLLLAQCSAWPRGERPAGFEEPLHGGLPVLVLAGSFDPVTPPRYGEAIVAGLDNARLVVAPGQGHNVLGAGCIPDLVARFLDELEPAGLDAACVGRLGPEPAFLDYNGARP